MTLFRVLLFLHLFFATSQVLRWTCCNSGSIMDPEMFDLALAPDDLDSLIFPHCDDEVIINVESDLFLSSILAFGSYVFTGNASLTIADQGFFDTVVFHLNVTLLNDFVVLHHLSVMENSAVWFFTSESSVAILNLYGMVQINGYISFQSVHLLTAACIFEVNIHTHIQHSLVCFSGILLSSTSSKLSLQSIQILGTVRFSGLLLVTDTFESSNSFIDFSRMEVTILSSAKLNDSFVSLTIDANFALFNSSLVLDHCSARFCSDCFVKCELCSTVFSHSLIESSGSPIFDLDTSSVLVLQFSHLSLYFSPLYLHYDHFEQLVLFDVVFSLYDNSSFSLFLHSSSSRFSLSSYDFSTAHLFIPSLAQLSIVVVSDDSNVEISSINDELISITTLVLQGGLLIVDGGLLVEHFSLSSGAIIGDFSDFSNITVGSFSLIDTGFSLDCFSIHLPIFVTSVLYYNRNLFLDSFLAGLDNVFLMNTANITVISQDNSLIAFGGAIGSIVLQNSIAFLDNMICRDCQFDCSMCLDDECVVTFHGNVLFDTFSASNCRLYFYNSIFSFATSDSIDFPVLDVSNSTLIFVSSFITNHDIILIWLNVHCHLYDESSLIVSPVSCFSSDIFIFVQGNSNLRIGSNLLNIDFLVISDDSRVTVSSVDNEVAEIDTLIMQNGVLTLECCALVDNLVMFDGRISTNDPVFSNLSASTVSLLGSHGFNHLKINIPFFVLSSCYYILPSSCSGLDFDFSNVFLMNTANITVISQDNSLIAFGGAIGSIVLQNSIAFLDNMICRDCQFDCSMCLDDECVVTFHGNVLFDTFSASNCRLYFYNSIFSFATSDSIDFPVLDVSNSTLIFVSSFITNHDIILIWLNVHCHLYDESSLIVSPVSCFSSDIFIFVQGNSNLRIGSNLLNIDFLVISDDSRVTVSSVDNEVAEIDTLIMQNGVLTLECCALVDNLVMFDGRISTNDPVFSNLSASTVSLLGSHGFNHLKINIPFFVLSSCYYILPSSCSGLDFDFSNVFLMNTANITVISQDNSLIAFLVVQLAQLFYRTALLFLII
ncbi:hypothetical protein RCL1_005878 [Eukaryota sp. TZLM3-RCL]